MINSLNRKYKNKREKSGSEDKIVWFMLSQCCESSLTCSSPPFQPPPKLQGEEREEKGGPEKKFEM